MIIALDYDRTITADPEMFRYLVEEFGDRHEFIVVTNRRPIEPVDDWWDRAVDVYYTNGHAKRDFLANEGVYPDLWIDDEPEYITENKRDYL